MTDRIDRYLHGILGRAGLDSAERVEADAVERVLVETRAFVALHPAPDLTDAVLRRVEMLPPHRQTRLRRSALAEFAETLWTAQQLSVRFRPIYAVLVVVILVGLAGLSVYRERSIADVAPFVVTAADQRLLVQFRLLSRDASSVKLAGSFTNWQPEHALHQTAPGVWTVTLPMRPGIHDYVFIVDGDRWVADPFAQQVSDGFGGINSRLALLPPEPPRS